MHASIKKYFEVDSV